MSKKKSVSVRAKELLSFVHELKDSGADFVSAHNAIHAPGGKMDALFPTEEEKAKYRQTPQCEQMWRVLDTFSPPGGDIKGPADVSGKFVVRLPKSLHAALAFEAEDEGVSLNQLVVAKLAGRMRQPV